MSAEVEQIKDNTRAKVASGSEEPETVKSDIEGITEFKNRNYPGKPKVVEKEAPKRSMSSMMGGFGL